MKNGLSFVDTNILMYRAGAQDAQKKKVATELCNTLEFGLSTQVLQEFYVGATHPRKLGLSEEEAADLLEALCEFPIHVLDVQAITDALRIQKTYRISYWDAAIVASAKALGCTTIYTEDLNDGQKYEGMEVVNPFKD